jgi:4-diphosphocytidyl-2-C-methyl-D-erythritol kinase
MIVFPNCKINLGLNILKKRNDGYHDLETIFYPLPLTDALEIIETKPNERISEFPFSSSGKAVPGKPASNLCVKAYRLLKRDFPSIPDVHIHLHKVIPSGAGLGGGSADAAFTLKLLNQLLQLSLSNDELIEYALQLGSDCPFFIINKPCYAVGRGEKLEPLAIDLSAYKFVVVNPGIHIDTGRAFLEIKPAQPEKNIKDIITEPVERWKDDLKNDFEKIIFQKHREIVEIKDNMYKAGALFASMSGTGSTVFGIFPKEEKINLKFPANYYSVELASQ